MTIETRAIVYNAELLQYTFARTLENKEMPDHQKAPALMGIINNIANAAKGLKGDQDNLAVVSRIFDRCAKDLKLSGLNLDAVADLITTSAKLIPTT